MKFANLISPLIFFGLVAAAAFTGTQFEPGSWYASIEKPSWTPPNKVFGPVWTVLYIAIAVAGWRAWREAPGPRLGAPAIRLWGAQLILNAMWSWVFFGLNQPALALVVIILLLLTIIGFVIKVRCRLAASLFVIYGLWVAFASALNFEIVRLNL